MHVILNILITYKEVFLIVNILAVINLLVLSLFLLIRKKNSLPNYILAFVTYLPVNNFIFNLFFISGSVFDYPYTILIGTSIVNTLFPLFFYLYIRLLTGKSLKKKAIYVPWLFILVASVFFQTYFISLSHEQQIDFLKKMFEGTPPKEFKITNIIFFFITLVYAVSGAITAVINYKNINTKPVDKTEVIRAGYVKMLSLIILILSLSIMILYGIIPYRWVDFFVLPLSMTIVFFVIVFSAQKSASIFSLNDFRVMISYRKDIDENNKADNLKKLYPKINIEFIETILNKEIENKFYLDINTSLSFVAEKYNISKHYISAYIHERYGMSFPDFVNKFRVEHAIGLLENSKDKNLSIEGIGKSAGFNSRASFYRSFKKFTLKSPKEYISNNP